MTLIWECKTNARCIIEHHQGYIFLFTNVNNQGQRIDHHYLLQSTVDSSHFHDLLQKVFANEQELIIEDVDLSLTFGAYSKRQKKIWTMFNFFTSSWCQDFNPWDLPLPDHVSQILPGPNYDFFPSTMRFTIISPVMPDAVVDYDLLNGLLSSNKTCFMKEHEYYMDQHILLAIVRSHQSPKLSSSDDGDVHPWNDLSEYYACEEYDVFSHDGISVPLTILYSRHKKQNGTNPGLLNGHGAYGEVLDKRWRNELKSLLDRGWVIAYADVRGWGRKWHDDGRRTKKLNSIKDYLACATFLIEMEIVEQTKFAGWGYSAGGLLVASALNFCPDLFQAAILKAPFLDPTNTLMYPILPLTPVDYEEFGYPGDIEDFRAICEYSPYDNIRKEALYPAILVTSSLGTRFGVWEAAKWVARLREYSVFDPRRPILLNLTTDIVEENRYLYSNEAAMEIAFLIKMVDSQS